jgi:hypothetical protein
VRSPHADLFDVPIAVVANKATGQDLAAQIDPGFEHGPKAL